MDNAFSYAPWNTAAAGYHFQHLMDSPFVYPVRPWRIANPSRNCWSYGPEPEPEPASGSRPHFVSIPITFVGSDGGDKTAREPSAEASRMAAAIAIQRALRGYLARKNMKVVSQVAVELSGIERSVRSEEERLRADPKERLRVHEVLMALLFRLDSVRGIRDYRKKMIRRVIVLQEFLDSISAGTLVSTNSSGAKAPIVAEMLPENLDSDTVYQEAEEIPNKSVEESMAQDCQDPAAGIAEEVAPREGLETPDHINDLKTEEEEAANDGFVVVLVEEAAGKSPAFESMEQENRETTAVPAEEAPEVSTTTTAMAEGAIEEEASQANSTAGASGMEEVLKQVMAESERLRELVATLCQRSAQQCQLMVGMAGRIEHLERAMKRMDKKDKKRCANSSLASLR